MIEVHKSAHFFFSNSFMKVTLPLILASLTALHIVKAHPELICSLSDPSDCYPKLFEPTDQWQVIREGQEIPAGLHVRLNVDTLKKEARFIQDEEASDSTENLLVIQEQSTDPEQEQADVEQHILDKINQFKQQQNDMQEHLTKTRVTLGDVKEFAAAVEEIDFVSPSSDVTRVSDALDTLEDLSHDIEFGCKLTQTPEIFQKLFHLDENLGGVSVEQLQDKALRVMAGALRNNPEALDNVVSKQPDTFGDELFGKLTSTSSDILQKRILGVIQALTQNKKFVEKYFVQTSVGLDQLVAAFPALGSESKTRLVNIFQDINILVPEPASSNSKRSVEDSANPAKQYSDFLQQQLVEGRHTSESQFRLFFTKLSEVHQQNKQLQPSKTFLAWLAEEAQTRAQSVGEKKRDVANYSDEDEAFDRGMLEARHLVFGNPNAMRKALADEL